MRSFAWPFAAGAIFGVGLLVSGMTQPQRITGFLDVGGAWDPTAGFVVASAVLVYGVLLRVVVPRRSPLYAEKFHLPTRSDVDRRLVVGSALFGLGWGLGGYCPGPGLVAAASASLPAVLFVVAMALGMALDRVVSEKGASP